jgi:phosphatidylserine decarboxylase
MALASKECLRILAPFLVVWFLLLLIGTAWAMLACIILSALILFTIYFFRDPEREVPRDEKIIVAAADGLVVGIDEVEDKHFNLGPMKRVSIFLSVFNVHINRMPIEGRIKDTLYIKGKFHDVRHPDASAANEALVWLIETPRGPVIVKQIAGLIARRIVAWAHVHDKLARGDRFGMIRFGSRTEIFLPLDCEITAKFGDRVKGAESPIARWPSANTAA